MNMVNDFLVKLSLIGVFLGTTLLGELVWFKLKFKNKIPYKFIEFTFYILTTLYTLVFVYFNLYKDKFQICFYIFILFIILELILLIKYKLWGDIKFFIIRFFVYIGITFIIMNM